MTHSHWLITSVDDDIYQKDFSVTADDVAHTPDAWSISRRSLRGGRSDGVDLIEVDNGLLQLSILPTRGMSLWRGKLGDLPLGWQSPIRGPVHPGFVPLMEPGGLGWLDGFDELLVRCGLSSNGPPEFDEQGRLVHPLHGRIANTPAHRVEVAVDAQQEEISVTGVVDEFRFHFQKLRLTTTYTTKFHSAEFAVHDRVTNCGSAEVEFELLYHVNIGPPLLEAGSRLVAPVKKLVPRNQHAAGEIETWNSYPPPTPGSEERVYFFDLCADENDQTQVLLHNAAADRGVGLTFNKRQLPCFSQWKNTPDLRDGYVTGIEPATNYPNPRAFESEHHRTVPLSPGESYSIDWTFTAFNESVEVARQQIEQLQRGCEPEICRTPQTDWCAE